MKFMPLRNKYLFLLFFIQASSAIVQAQLLVEAGVNTTICNGYTADLGGSPSASGGNEPYTYSWTPAFEVSNDTIANPVTGVLTATTLFHLTVTDNSGNSALDSILVFVDFALSCSALTFYNTFTPNKDEVNDTWTIVNAEQYPQNSLEIYNRYGKLVYKESPYNNSWAGTGLGEELPAATYYYIFDPGEGLEIKKGSVTIIR